MSKVKILGVGFDPVSPEEAFNKVVMLLKEDKTSFIVTPNPEMLTDASNNRDLYLALNSADLSIADGIGVIYAAKILNVPLKERVTGIGLMHDILEFLGKTERTYFLFGAKPNVAVKASENIDKTYEGIKCVGVRDGYFDEKEEFKIIDEINEAKPDVLFVGLGSPKQELWVYENLKMLNASVCICIGGAIDVYSGIIKRAPKWISKIGFEWLYRAIKEPKRFKRLLKIPSFLIKVVKSKY